MAMLKVICDEKLYDKEFCDKWVYGLEAVCERVADMDLDELCERAWVDKEDVVRVARTYATSHPAAIQWGVALDQQTGGQQAAHAITAMWCITGNLDIPGGNVMADACWGIEQPNWVGTWGWDELMTPEEQAKRIGIERYPMFAVGFKNLSSNATIEAWQRGEIPIHAAYIVTNNFLATMGAQAEQQLEWYKQIDFIVVEDLFAKYPSVAALAAAEPEDIEAIVKPCGLGHSKARDISACMRMLRDKYDCQVPATFEELLALPGVGRKSANLIMGDVFGKPAIVTDTHCIRLCNKIGLVDGIKEPQKVEMALWKIIPPEEGSDLCHRFVMHGRAVCNARKPECEKCCLNDICRYAREQSGADTAQ